MTDPYTTPRNPIDDLKRTLRFIGVFVGGILLGVVIFGAAGMVLLNEKTNDIVRTRTESRAALCVRFHKFEVAHNALVRRAQSLVHTDQARAELETNIVPVDECDPVSIARSYTTTTTEVQP